MAEGGVETTAALRVLPTKLLLTDTRETDRRRLDVARLSRRTCAAAGAGGLGAEPARRWLGAGTVLALRVTDETRWASAAADVLADRLARRPALALIRSVRRAQLAGRTGAAALPGRGIDAARRRAARALGSLEVARAARSRQIARARARAGERILVAWAGLTDARLRGVGRQRALVGGIRTAPELDTKT